MYDWIVDTINHVIRNGWSAAALAGAVFSLLKIRRIRKQVMRHLPQVFRDRDDERLDMIVEQNNEILRRLGGDPWPNNAKQFDPWKPYSVQRNRKSFISCLAGFITVPFARNNTNYHGRVRKRMKWLKPEFLTFVVGAVVVILNDRFGWGLSQEGVIAFFVTIGSYLLQQGIVNVKRGEDGAFAGLSVNSRKLIFTLVGALMIGLNEALQLGFGAESIWMVAGLVTGYNAVEGARDAKAAATPPTTVNFPSPIGFGRHSEQADDQSH